MAGHNEAPDRTQFLPEALSNLQGHPAQPKASRKSSFREDWGREGGSQPMWLLKDPHVDTQGRAGSRQPHGALVAPSFGHPGNKQPSCPAPCGALQPRQPGCKHSLSRGCSQHPGALQPLKLGSAPLLAPAATQGTSLCLPCHPFCLPGGIFEEPSGSSQEMLLLLGQRQAGDPGQADEAPRWVLVLQRGTGTWGVAKSPLQ